MGQLREDGGPLLLDVRTAVRKRAFLAIRPGTMHRHRFQRRSAADGTERERRQLREQLLVRTTADHFVSVTQPPASAQTGQ